MGFLPAETPERKSGRERERHTEKEGERKGGRKKAKKGMVYSMDVYLERGERSGRERPSI